MYYFIVNGQSRSGSGGSVWEKVSTLLKAGRVEYRVRNTLYKGHAAEIARNICKSAEPDKRIVVIGGDGTVNEVINGITDFEHVSLSVIPTGSGNDFARGLGLPKNPEEGLRNILRCKTVRAMDLGQVSCPETGTERLFAISAGVGMDALVCKKVNTSKIKRLLNTLHLGNLSYLVLTVQSLFTMDTEKVRVCVNNGEEYRSFDKLIFLSAMNFRAEGGGVPMAPKASAFDGELSVCTASEIPKWKAFLLLPFLVAAKHENLRGFDLMGGRRIELKSAKPMVLHTDGEYIGDYKDIVFECLPKRLRIRR